MKKYLFLATAISIVFILSNCKKSSPKVTVLETDTAVLSHFSYKPGTYWIYRDSLTGRVDDFIVRSNTIVKQQLNPTEIYQYQIIDISDINIDGSNPADSSFWIINLQNNGINIDYDYQHLTLNEGWNAYIHYSPLINYPFQVGNLNSGYDTGIVTNIYSSYNVNGLPFSNVAEIHHFINVDSNYGNGITKIDDWFYDDADVGIVKMRLYHPYHGINHVWELKNYNIVK